MLWTAIAALGLLLAGCSHDNESKAEQLPSFSVEPLAKQGAKVSSDSFKGKVLLIDFWATWCGPCRESMPDLQRLYDSYKAQGLDVMSISNEDRPTVAKFRDGSPYSYPIYLDPEADSHHKLNVEALPAIVVVGRDGKILLKQEGYGPGAEAPIEEAIKTGLKG